ncbi:hypothetical protein DB30_01546 [Enhygromyxa salina]|uniref:Uncharacterized protein n=1 Tax=Enhygromyxa salina TaxID=215803 RepID=A0A0C2CRT9_9BACT|nr:hypothetical protein DB30_01546 [Enhygromyxa salina]
MIIVFAVMWAVILYGAFRLFTWLYRLDRENREGKAPYDHGL